jgi:hypothetical protein
MADRYILIWLDRQDTITRATIGPIRRAIREKVRSKPEDVEIDVWLDSPGGDAHAAYKLALMLHAAAAKVRVVIPDFAKSAATLLAVAGHEIYLAPGADLGPLDAQMPDEGSMSGTISALNVARAADEVARDAVEMAMNGGADLLAITGLSRAQTIDAMLTFSARFSEPLVRQLDPKVVHHAKQTLQVTAKYADHLLEATGVNNHELIARRLVETFPTHGYVICSEEAAELGLPVQNLTNYDHADAVEQAFEATEGGPGIIEILPAEDVVDVELKTTKAQPKGSRKQIKKGGGRNAASKRGGPSDGKSNGRAETVDANS